MAVMGIAYCLTASSLWSGISLVVRKRQVGSAMAFVTAAQMALVTVINLIVGRLEPGP